MKTKFIKTFALALVIFCLGMCFVGCSNSNKEDRIVELLGNFSLDKSQYYTVCNTEQENSTQEVGYDYVRKDANGSITAMVNSYDINITESVIYIAISRIYLGTQANDNDAMSVLLKCGYHKSGNVINVISTKVLSSVGENVINTQEKVALVENYSYFILEAKKGYMELTTNFFDLIYLSDLQTDIQFKIPFKPAKGY